MNKQLTAQALVTIANILDIEGENPFRVRAFKQAAESLLTSSTPLDDILSGRVHVKGIGKDTIQLLKTLQRDGLRAALATLSTTTPPSVTQLLAVPGIGPRTAHVLYNKHQISSLEDLKAALASGRLQGTTGFKSDKLRRMKRDVEVLEERLHALPVAVAWPLSRQIQQELQDIPGVVQVSISGTLRRFAIMCQRLDYVVAMSDSGASETWLSQQTILTKQEDYVEFQMAESPIPVRVYLVTNETFASTLMRTTGDETHQGVVSGLLQRTGYEWQPDGILDDAGNMVSVKTEADIYRLIGLPTYPPELREGAGLLCQPKKLVRQSDIRGDLHVHSQWSDGSLSIRDIVAMAEQLGYEYVAITDHSQSLTIANGLTPDDLKAQHEEILSVQQTTQVRILHGIEVDILRDGRLDLPDDVLFELDLVVASVHGAMYQGVRQMTDRIIKAIRHPAVDIIGHPTGRILGRRAGYELDMDLVFREALEHGVALELNANPNRLDLSDVWLRQAAKLGLPLAIDTDAHHLHEFAHMAYGIRMAHRGWLTRASVLNTLPLQQLLKALHKSRNR